MTAHPMPVPARITLALDACALHGPQVDIDCGTFEGNPAGDVDAWEAGTHLPTPTQVEKLAALTRMPVEFFYLPADELGGPSVTFLCDRRRRGENALTVVRSSVDYDGVLHREQLTPDRPPYRPSKPKAAGATTRRAGTRPRNGHHPDCPYPHQPAQTCSICAGIRKAAPDPEAP